MSDILHMSQEEVSRVQILEELIQKHIKQSQAAERLGVTVRQIKRLKKAYKKDGAKALVSKKRGRPSNHQLQPKIKAQALALIRQHYADFGPTLAREKLIEKHHLQIGLETVRQLMIQDGLWDPKHAKRPVVHPLRERRAQRGELVQIDGSPFDWFEGRAPVCTLLVFIDDATSELLELCFTEAATTFSYFEATEHYLPREGKPKAFYSDRLSVFRVNQPNALTGEGTTQFGRAIHELDIAILCATTPQAKGRVERANQTLQDRLPKEMRLRGLSTMAAANAYLTEFRQDYNRRFAVGARNPVDAHRPLLPKDNLARILTIQELRHLSKNLTLNYQNVIYQIQTARPTYALRQAQVVVREDRHGTITIEYKGKTLPYTVYHRQTKQAVITPSKLIDAALSTRPVRKKKSKPYVPAPDHPWRQFQINTPTQR